MKLLPTIVLLVCVAGTVNDFVFADGNPQAAAATPSDDTVREFHAAIAAGDTRLAEKMLTFYPELVTAALPDDDPAKRREPLYTAIDHVQAPMLAMLLKHGASSAIGTTRDTPLFHAAIFGNVEILRILLDAGANVDGLDDPANLTDLDNPTHCTPLRNAVSCGHLEMARYLVQRGAHIDICSAAGLGWTGWVAKQIEAHPEQADITDDWRYTPLCYAVAGGCAGAAEILLSHGADIAHTYDDGGTLLQLATLNGYHDLMVVLLAHGADVNAKNKAGQTALDMAAKYNLDDAEELLRDHGGKRGSELND